MNPLVSVNVITYNRKEILQETIHSILNQSYQHFELIVVDNFSNYDFFSFINTFKDPRIKAFQNRNDGIYMVNRNFAIQHSKGEFIAFCDDDDLWHPEKLEKQVKAFKKNDSLLLVGCARIDFGSTHFLLNLWAYFARCLDSTRTISFREMLRENNIPNSSFLVKKEVFEIIGPIDESRELNGAADYELLLRILNYRDNSVLRLKQPLLRYRVHSSNLTDNLSDHSSNRLELILGKYKKTHPSEVESSLRHYRFLNERSRLYKHRISPSYFLKLEEFNFVSKIFTVCKYYLFRKLFRVSYY